MSPETFLDIFAPPDGLVGHSAALVAMTGTEDFLEDAVQRFTGLRPRQRAELGHVLVYLMLDGHSSASRKEVFPPGRIPGLHELQPRPVDPGSLLHAKVALLAFAPNRTGAPEHTRLAVLTANFTYTSARQQLELLWLVDVPLGGSAEPEDCADIRAAGEFVRLLINRRFYADSHGLTARLETLITVASSLKTKGSPRFIHSLSKCLYDRIKERFEHIVRTPRNFLLCGSGFYEEPSGKANKPTILGKLEALDIFTRNPFRVALVEPSEAGALAGWARDGDTDGWELVRPHDTLGPARRLHAKFVYVGHLRDGHTSNGGLYLGSGNLSRRGILSHGDMKQGNIESGVVIDVPERLTPECLERLLFWSQDETEAVGDDEWAVGEVGDGPDDQPILEAPPILSATIKPTSSRHLSVHWRDGANATHVSVSWTGRDWLDVRGANEIRLEEGDRPTVLRVRDGGDREWVVPVVDAEGRVGWEPARFDNYADALAALLDFSIDPAYVSDDGFDEDSNGGPMGTAMDASAEQGKRYALHAAAELIEKVAALQARLPETMLDDWLDHLDRNFRASFPEALIAAWRSHHLDVFAHLRQPELRPPSLTEKQLARYCEVLDDVASAWRLR